MKTGPAASVAGLFEIDPLCANTVSMADVTDPSFWGSPVVLGARVKTPNF